MGFGIFFPPSARRALRDQPRHRLRQFLEMKRFLHEGVAPRDFVRMTLPAEKEHRDFLRARITEFEPAAGGFEIHAVFISPVPHAVTLANPDAGVPEAGWSGKHRGRGENSKLQISNPKQIPKAKLQQKPTRHGWSGQAALEFRFWNLFGI